MQRKNVRLGWSAGILGLSLLAIVSCSPSQKDNKQTDEAPVAQQPEVEMIEIEPDASIQQPVVEDSETIMLNPPHGEPGHRCEIPVGSPLNSPPTVTQDVSNVPAPAPAASTTEAASGYRSMAPTVENAQRLNATQRTQSAAPATGEKPQLNPPHGQPWHRCDIAVGAPLS